MMFLLVQKQEVEKLVMVIKEAMMQSILLEVFLKIIRKMAEDILYKMELYMLVILQKMNHVEILSIIEKKENLKENLQKVIFCTKNQKLQIIYSLIF